MRILWICNIMPPMIGQYLGKECSVKEGWISGILTRLAKDHEEITLGICYPVEEALEEEKKEIKLENNKNITCYGFVEDMVHPENYGGEALEHRFKVIMDDFKPEVLHVFGTEYGHALAAAKAMNNSSHILIGLQGVISECAKEYMADLPNKIQAKISFRDWLKKDSMKEQQEKFFLRGEREKEVLKLCGHITGRTEFDKKAAEQMNPQATYHTMNETMRGEFYTGQWDKEKCTKHSIFFSQADYPLKGFHYLLQALGEIREKYPDVTVKVAGNSLVSYQTMKDKIKISAYGKYLRKLIKELKMGDKITFLGKLSAGEMKQQYLDCHTFVCASSLENSPNSVGEAMLLGTPVVASYTGGIPSMVTDGKEGLLFEKGNVTALAKAIMKTWEDSALVDEMSKNAGNRARQTHDADENYKTLIAIYKNIVQG
ncbi:MAG: glycosyltransferase family 4 protein [Lachnospiraceae bacterium]|nr:glycosyltransferase family 4 protein [Lachnospiraceae bacterium]